MKATESSLTPGERVPAGVKGTIQNVLAEHGLDHEPLSNEICEALVAHFEQRGRAYVVNALISRYGPPSLANLPPQLTHENAEGMAVCVLAALGWPS